MQGGLFFKKYHASPGGPCGPPGLRKCEREVLHFAQGPYGPLGSGKIVRRVLTLGGGWYPKPSTTSSPRLIAMVAHIGFNNILLTVTFANLRMSKIWHHFFYWSYFYTWLNHDLNAILNIGACVLKLKNGKLLLDIVTIHIYIWFVKSTTLRPGGPSGPPGSRKIVGIRKTPVELEPPTHPIPPTHR